MLVYAVLEPISGSVYKMHRCQMIDRAAGVGHALGGAGRDGAGDCGGIMDKVQRRGKQKVVPFLLMADESSCILILSLAMAMVSY
jgi:hypothetical protein